MSSFKQAVTLVHCDHLATFSVEGEDARTFLQSQLTQDMSTVSAENAALAGFCTAQGRLWASMLLAQTNDGTFVGVASADLMESFLKRLKMFVLRSKVTISPTAEQRVYGVEVGTDDINAMCALLACKLPEATWASESTPMGTWIRVPAGAGTNGVRFLLVVHTAEFDQLRNELAEHAQTSSSALDWQFGDIKAGLPWVQAATQDLFIAQTLNLDLIGGVSFTKGCYPGQEVIARAHYRGTVKRRMHLATISPTNDQIMAGADLFESGEPDNPIGRVINIARAKGIEDKADVAWVLFEAPFKSVQSSTLHVGSADGPALAIEPMPYALVSEQT